MVEPQQNGETSTAISMDRGISEGTNLNQMMIEIEQMRNLCVLYGSPPLLVINSENFVIILNSPHTTFTQGLDYNTYYPQYPTLKASPSNLQNVREIVFPRILLALCWEPNFRFRLHKFVGFYLHHRNLQTKHRHFRNEQCRCPNFFQEVLSH
jgi:hypothetical protein